MSRRGGNKKRQQREEEEEKKEEVVDLLNFPAPSPSSPSEEKYGTWIMLGVAAIISAVYYATLFPTVPGGDSAELIISAYQMSIAHPPGYPLFTILGHIFTYLPFHNPAWRVNLMSASCGVLSAVFLYCAVAKWTGNRAAGALSALLFAFSPLVWTYTIQAEVFSMNNLLVNTSIYLVIAYSHYSSLNNPKYLMMANLGALVGGFGVANQHTIVFLFVPIAAWIFFIAGRKDFLFTPSRWLTLLGYMLLGLSPYIHLLVSPHLHQEKYSWGDTGNVGGFLHHFLRKEYGTFQLYSGSISDSTGLQTRIKLYFTRLTGEILYVGVPLAAVGLWASLRGKNKIIFSSVGYLIAFCHLIYITFFLYLTNLPIQNSLHLGVLLRFFMQPNAIVCVWVGLGYAFIESKLVKRGLPRIIPLIFAALLASAQLTLNYKEMDQHDNWYFYHYGHAILDPLPHHALLLAGGDVQTNVPNYLQLCEGVRPDVDILSIETMSWDWYKPRMGPLYPDVVFPGYVYHPFKPGAYSMKQFLDANYGKRQLFLSGEWKVGDPTVETSYATAPWGLSHFIHPINNPPPVWEHAAKSEHTMWPLNLTTWQPPPTCKYGPETWEYLLHSNFWESYERRANMFLIHGFKQEPDSEKAMKEVIRLLQFAREHRSVPSRWTLKYLGAALDHMRMWHPDKKHYIDKLVEVWKEFVELGNPDNDRDFETIQTAIATYEKK